jgi:hypothetical protein
LRLMKKTGRIISYNQLILLEKTGYVTYSGPYTKIWRHFSIRMLIKISIGFAVADEEGYPGML